MEASARGDRKVRLYIDGKQVGEGRLQATAPLIFFADETAVLGRDST